MAYVLLIGLAILAIGFWLWVRGRAGEKRLGVPVQQIITADMGVEVPLKAGSQPMVLFSKRYRVTGKMDYLTDDQGVFVPMEYKPAKVREPRDSDVFQLLTYCFLLEEKGYAVNRGRLKYGNGICGVPYGPRERQEVLQVLAEMRRAEKVPLQNIPGKQDQRCRGCEYRTLCAEEEY